MNSVLTRFVVILITALSLSACGSDIYGKWSRSETVSGVSFKITLNIEAEKVTVTSDCSYPDGTTLSASTSSSAEITSNEFKIKESTSSKATGTGKTCEATTSVNTSTYEVDDTILKLTSGGVTSNFTQVK